MGWRSWQQGADFLYQSVSESCFFANCSLATSVGLLIWSAVIIWVCLAVFIKRPWVLDLIDAKVITNLVVTSSFIG